MSKAAVATVVAVLVAGGGLAYQQRKHSAALRGDLALLRAEVGALRQQERTPRDPSPAVAMPLPATNSASADRTSVELAKLREEIAALRKNTSALSEFAQMAQAAQALKANSDTIATKLSPVSEWRNAGKASPAAATETALWAAVGGDIDTLAATMTFIPSARAKADAWFAGLSEATRQKYGTPEKVLALMIARDASALTGMQVLGQKEISADDVGVRVRFAAGEGKSKDETFVMRRTGDGWRMLLADNTVEKFARQLGGK